MALQEIFIPHTHYDWAKLSQNPINALLFRTQEAVNEGSEFNVSSRDISVST